ncbi:MAG: DNA polymerase III subunit gamma/tau, partial [bacterium]|nr:DNA polymerase III subunit gamma/tau [bacterium]
MASSTYIVSALKHRPQTFTDVLAQEHVTRTLQHSLERGQIANAYLFAGPRGTGKTTTARILSKALNCENLQNAEPCNACPTCKAINRGTFIDVLEIDAASNRGIEEIRNLRENVRFSPTQGKYKVYIIDEVHMLTDAAYNAFLKTLEEPPAHSRFIMATTELHKIPNTILSRCQRFQFRRIPIQVIVDHLKRIVTQQEGLEIANPAEMDRILYHLARASEGGLRDALVSLDQLLAFCSGKLDLAQVEEILGVIEFDLQDRFLSAIFQHNLQQILDIIEELSNRGSEMSWFLKECIQFLRNLAVSKIAKDTTNLIDMPEEYRTRLKESAKQTSLEQILYITDVFWAADARLRYSPDARLILEMMAIKAAKAGQAVKVEDILGKLASGTLAMPVAAPAPALATPAPAPALVAPQAPVNQPQAVESATSAAPPALIAPTPGDKPQAAAPLEQPVAETIAALAPDDALPQTEAIVPQAEETLPLVPPVQPTADVPTSSTLQSAWSQILREIEATDPVIAAA